MRPTRGARRSVLLQLRIDDVDFETNQALIRECKKARRLRTTRRVPLSGYLQRTLEEWLSRHPGGTMLFVRNGEWRGQELPLNPTMASLHLRRMTKGTIWQVLRGWHVLRHSFFPRVRPRAWTSACYKAGWATCRPRHTSVTHLVP